MNPSGINHPNFTHQNPTITSDSSAERPSKKAKTTASEQQNDFTLRNSPTREFTSEPYAKHITEPRANDVLVG